ncbi:ATP phosphoribosyltransferase regulatory subunit [Candidatus Sumerlaeota bacterium]|nr:ATP phosphoribosyltransferase regulatory subunit [Candidatus Sumerlaeota bacterium]
MKFHADWLPEDMNRFRKIEDIFRRVCLRHGYGEARTPVIEKLHWFTGAGVLSPTLMRKIYTFLDWDGWSGERVVLRPDNTVPICRLFAENHGRDKRAKIFYVEDVFRYDDIERRGGRQCQMGVEMLGNFPKPVIRDVEILLLLFDFLKELRIGKIRLVLSHAGILRAYLKTLSLTKEEEAEAFDLLMEGRTVDLRKVCEDRCNLEGLNRLLELRGSSASFLTNLKTLGRASRDFVQATEELEEIAFHLEQLKYSFEIIPGIRKDLTYYTGMMFDAYVDEIKVGGGGRYDRLLEKFMKVKTGGCGFSVYVEPLMELMKREETSPPVPFRIDVIADLQRREAALESLRLSEELRRRGMKAEILSMEEISRAGDSRCVIKKTKSGFSLEAHTGKKRKIFNLPLRNAGELLQFWGKKK